MAELATHTHVQNAHGHRVRTESGKKNTTENNNSSAWEAYAGSLAADSNKLENTTAINLNAGLGAAHENRPPYYALAFIMKL